jgi:hypothetical protein
MLEKTKGQTTNDKSRENQRGNQRMTNPGKLATLGTQDTRQKQKKIKNHNTICAGHHYKQTNTNNVNKTRLLLTTGSEI